MSDKFLPKTFESCGVICSPLGRSATADSIKFRQPLPLSARPKKSFCFWIGRNIQVWVYPKNIVWVMEITVFSLPKLANGRSSSLIKNYFDVILKLNKKVNAELLRRKQTIEFDAFEAEIIRLDLFVDLRFKNNLEMREFYNLAKQLFIDDLPFTTDFDGGFYRHSGDTLKTSTELLRLYYKENRERTNQSDELNRNKLRLETSLQNYNRMKVVTDIARRIKQSETSYTVRIKSDDARIKNSYRVYENKYAANVFRLLTQDALDTIFYLTAKDILIN